MLQYNPKPGLGDFAWRVQRSLKRRLRKARSYFTERSPRNVQTRSSLGPPQSDRAIAHLSPGDVVRVRSREEIQASLDGSGQLCGYAFMDGMWQYCGTRRRVYKRVNQFLDERDYRMKKLERTVLLEGVICEGTEKHGPCDRACYYFWREEWLEKLD